MIRVHLPDGRIASFPDGTSPEAISQALARYRVATGAAEASPTSAAVNPTDPSLDALQGHQTAIDAPSDTGLAFGPTAPRLAIQEYRHEDEVDRDELTARRIDELRKRSGVRDPISVDPPPGAESGTHNWHPNWRRR